MDDLFAGMTCNNNVFVPYLADRTKILHGIRGFNISWIDNTWDGMGFV